MPAPTREQVWSALKTRLDGLLVTASPPGPFLKVSRVWEHWSTAERSEQPALYVVETGETHAQDKGSPALRSLRADLVMYANRGDQPGIIASTTLNALIDAVEGALKPDVLAGADTLSDLVSHAWITDVEIVEGTLQDQAVVVVGIELLLNQDAVSPDRTFLFGSGALYATGIRRADGTAITGDDRQPVRLAGLKGVEVTFEGELTFARSTLHYALDAGWSARRISAVARAAEFDALAVEQVFFGQTAGAVASAVLEAGTFTIPGSPYQVTVSPAGLIAWTDDLGVYDGVTGVRLRRVASGTPAAGEYVNTTGSNVYTFAAADTGKVVRIGGLYTVAGRGISISQQQQYLAPTFRAVLYGRYNQKQVTLVLNRCATSRLLIPTSTEAFAVQEFAFEAVADEAGVVGNLGLA